VTAGFCLGIGLASGADISDAIELVDAALNLGDFEGRHIACIATIDGRGDHAVIVALAVHYQTRLQTFDSDRLERETSRLKNPSESLFKRIGCHGVAEAAALAAAGAEARLLVEKLSGRRVTVAIAG
jgi:cobalamin biosynthesis protein CbiG